MQSLEEMQGFLSAGQEDKKQARIHQLNERRAVGEKVSELIADPRWEVWGRHIEAIRASYQRRLDAAAAKILAPGLLLGGDYLRTKTEHLRAQAAVTALSEALTVAKVLIENGEQALEDLKILDGQHESENNGDR